LRSQIEFFVIATSALADAEATGLEENLATATAAQR
jgi:hypothetical protein